MAMTHQPVLFQTPKHPMVRISSANTSRDGSGTNGTLYTAGANGAIFAGFRWQAEGTTTAGVIRVHIQKAGSGNIELIREMLVAAITPSATVEAASGEWFPPAGIMLGAGDIVFVSTHNAETFSCWLEGGGDY